MDVVVGIEDECGVVEHIERSRYACMRFVKLVEHFDEAGVQRHHVALVTAQDGECFG